MTTGEQLATPTNLSIRESAVGKLVQSPFAYRFSHRASSSKGISSNDFAIGFLVYPSIKNVFNIDVLQTLLTRIIEELFG